MPWKLVAVLAVFGACVFDADYSGGAYKCTDGRCPSGLVCDRMANRCEASVDALGDAMIDARAPAFTCADPGDIPATGGSAMGTTVGRSSTVNASCGGFIMNGPDAVHRVMATAGDQFLIGVDSLKAYVITPCAAAPATPACLANTAAAPGNPIAVTAAATGPLFIVVDDPTPGISAAYELTITRQ